MAARELRTLGRADGAASRTTSAARTRRLVRRAVVAALVYAMLVTIGAFFMLPFAFMLTTALKPPDQIFELPFHLLPRTLTFKNFPDAIAALPFWQFTINTAIVTGTALVGETLVSAVVAFGFARLRFVGRDFWFMVLLATMMLPSQVTLIPLFILFKNLGWLDTLLPLVVPPVIGGAPFYVFLLRQFFLTLPRDLEDAAKIDGSSSFGILFRIFLPLSRPALASVVIFSFMFHWNDFFTPLVYLTSTKRKTLALGLQMFQGEYQNSWNLMMAAATIVLLPCALVFLLAQRHFVEGITMSGLKG